MRFFCSYQLVITVDGHYLIIRADASTRIGTGHLMRCLALGQAWKDAGAEVIFITSCDNESLLQRLRNEQFQIVMVKYPYPDPADWEITLRILSKHPDAWVVLDGYHFNSEYQRKVKEIGHNKLLVIDDMAHLDHYYADIVLNLNLHGEELSYSREAYTRLLLGTRYVLIRREFLKWREWKREIPEVARKVLVTMGGGDPDNVTLKVIRAMNRLKLRDLEVKVAIGPSNPHMASFKEAVNHSPFTIHLLPDVKNMPKLMAWADLAVSAAGSTCWELTFMGLPAVVLELAENQQGIAVGLDKAGVALCLGWHTEVSIAQIENRLSRLLEDRILRLQMSQQGQILVDGMGTDRVVESLLWSHSTLPVR
ncbi:MAG: UDP-2,4-diacetamido-2,4,6-trideoxy-beta-L-altropyranose hydrolase [Deltaproteobacteria bacterium]|nr:UDP-2,4-diacetamido-2,4,6-trideoxy-beta-L-altropyranose hydrolase [Deltaproteobacteria bacterium]MBW2152317.1 UDP-2,4-diacetamido-2,4,6-trideoxy-beta-L-altropyranose hydrolase [Deltaproteobacteria bacterium]